MAPHPMSGEKSSEAAPPAGPVAGYGFPPLSEDAAAAWASVLIDLVEREAVPTRPAERSEGSVAPAASA